MTLMGAWLSSETADVSSNSEYLSGDLGVGRSGRRHASAIRYGGWVHELDTLYVPERSNGWIRPITSQVDVWI
ncbi:unnamed protein product [Victoria cruziana]